MVTVWTNEQIDHHYHVTTKKAKFMLEYLDRASLDVFKSVYHLKRHENEMRKLERMVGTSLMMFRQLANGDAPHEILPTMYNYWSQTIYDSRKFETSDRPLLAATATFLCDTTRKMEKIMFANLVDVPIVEPLQL